MNVTRWLNIGLFEAVSFGRKNHFDFSYMNPIIFLRVAEQQNGSFDNAIVGWDFKANIARKAQLYGQLMLDEFFLKELRAGNGWWGNKFGLQVGGKYIDLFTIDNFDVQAEINLVRPFSYSHLDTIGNYTHYNQPLAHPLGANFQEWIGIARYQPHPKMLIQAKAFYAMQGKDTVGTLTSFGSNIFLPNISPYRTKEFGYELGSGIRTKTMLASLLLSYEWKPNLFFEINTVFRKQSATSIHPSEGTMIIYGGIRWNMHRRDFEF